ncbi:DUF922 domain-containing protein [Mesorhizobium sp. SB112]|uniref:DUF922 domain-containing Zn-dependent protease n=1 Tax=Mesorhizobium sp. SB112 TaxID=3151853 RepID=UPI0032658D3B
MTMAFAACLAVPASAASLSKTYSYFTIGGKTLSEIEDELGKRGPQVKTTGRRHPGATQMEFTTKISYSQDQKSCRIANAHVTVKANMFLPKWRQRHRAEQDTRLIWDTLSSDIKRHEESHVVIAKNHARELEDSLKNLGRFRNCEQAATAAKAKQTDILAKHDRAQIQFDRVEGKNFESRIMRLLEYRLKQIEAGRIPG